MAKIRRAGMNELDVNQRRIDDNLSNLESRLSDAYHRAGEGIQQRLDNFLSAYEAKDAEMLQRVNDGIIDEHEYIMWRQNNILRTRQMEAQINAITQDLVNVDGIAMQMVNGELPEIYTSSYNFGIYRADVQRAMVGGYNETSFSLYNADALRILETENPDLIPWKPCEQDIPKDKRWNRAHVQNAITQGILQGDSIAQLSKRLLPIVNMDENASRRTARTAYTSIQNQARRDATQAVRDTGIEMDEPWMSVLQANTRDTHLMLHGTLPNKDGLYGEGIIPSGNFLRYPADPDGDPEQIYNCQCRVQSFIHGIDHSHDDELYARFMQEQYPDDWETVQHYREQETAEALERKRQLDAGERIPREAQRYIREAGNEIDVDEFYKNPDDDKNGSGGFTLSMQERAQEIAQMSDEEIWRAFVPEDSFINDEQFRKEGEEFSKLYKERQELSSENYRLNEELASESMTKPRDQWDMKDEISAMLGDKPQTYTPRGEEILETISRNNDRIHELNPLISDISDKHNAIYQREAREQIDRWSSMNHSFTRAEDGETFYGFSTSMRSGYDEDLANGIGFIAEMSPQEYLDRISYEIFGSSVEQATAGIEYANIREYAQMMANGTQFDMGYLDYEHGGQEGRHRAMASQLLGIEKIPVYIRGRR